jgi:hypothetical protein
MDSEFKWLSVLEFSEACAILNCLKKARNVKIVEEGLEENLPAVLFPFPWVLCCKLPQSKGWLVTHCNHSLLGFRFKT